MVFRLPARDAESADARYMSANTRAVEARSRLRTASDCLRTSFQMAVGEARQKFAIPVCSAERTALLADPISSISL